MENKVINRKWIVDKDEYHIGRFKEEVFIISSKDLKEKGIAEVYDSESNALLISKAPEMLEILQEVVRKVSVAEYPILIEQIEQLIIEATELNQK